MKFSTYVVLTPGEGQNPVFIPDNLVVSPGISKNEFYADGAVVNEYLKKKDE